MLYCKQVQTGRFVKLEQLGRPAGVAHWCTISLRATLSKRGSGRTVPAWPGIAVMVMSGSFRSRATELETVAAPGVVADNLESTPRDLDRFDAHEVVLRSGVPREQR